MTKKILFAGIFLTTTLLNAQTERIKPKTFDEQFSYSVGYDVTKSLIELHAYIDKAWMMQGVADALSDSAGNPLITKEEMELVFQEFQKRTLEKGNQDKELANKKNRELGQAFVDEQMKTNKKMKKTNSGLVYLPIKEGKGQNPTPESTVNVKYKGELINGTVFDESTEPISFKLNQVIPGWVEGLQLMKPGATYKLIIPADLGYGVNPPPGTPIEVGSTLVFTVELISVQ